jgi:diguanylate cyclase (GGDEF)-like protein
MVLGVFTRKGTARRRLRRFKPVPGGVDNTPVTVPTPLPPDVGRRLTRHGLTQVSRNAPGGVLAGFSLAACVWGQVDHVRLLVWTSAADLLIALATAAAVIGLRDGRPAVERRAERVVAGAYLVQGLLLGSVSLLVPAPGQVTDAIYVAFTVASAAAFLLISRISAVLFAACQVSTLGTAALMVVLGYSDVPHPMAAVEAIFLAVLVATRTELVRGIRQAAGNERRAEQLAADLAVERDRTVAANDRLAAANEQLATANRALAHQAGHDTLTGLANREQFLSHLTAALPRARRQGRQVAVLFFDLDRFKIVNDASGHATGDRLLQEVADRAVAAVRDGDVVARHGGDEFTVLLPAVESVQEAVAVAERLRVALSEPMEVGGERIDTSSSIGIALDASPVDRPEDLLRHADCALYRAKDGGRNRIEVFDDAHRASVRRRLTDEAELRAAIEQGRIVPWFQPVVDMRTGAMVGAEALARWVHPERGVLLPGAFFPLAVESGLSGLLGASVARQAIELRHRIASRVDEDFAVAVNVAARAMRLEQIIEAIAQMVTELGACPRGITVEITETSVITDLDAAREALTRARSLGFSVALDDFGTGYSALSLVRDLPLDIVKIDRSFVQGMARTAADAAVIHSVLDLAGRLGLRVIAEGVETDDETGRLLAAGARRAQGFRYSPAVPEREFERWLTEGVPWLDAADHAVLVPRQREITDQPVEQPSRPA